MRSAPRASAVQGAQRTARPTLRVNQAGEANVHIRVLTAAKTWLKRPAPASCNRQAVWSGHSWVNSCFLNPALTLTGASWPVTELHPIKRTIRIKKKDQ